MEPLVPEHAGKTHALRNWKAGSRLQQRRLTIRASRLEGSEVEPSRPPEEVAWRSFWRRPRVDRTPRRHALSLHRTTLLFRRASEAPLTLFGLFSSTRMTAHVRTSRVRSTDTRVMWRNKLTLRKKSKSERLLARSAVSGAP